MKQARIPAVVGATLLGLAVAFPAPGAPRQGEDEAPSSSHIEDTRTVIEKWVETRRLISKEESDWAFGRELMQERVELTKRQIEVLRGRIEAAEKSIAEADVKRDELVAKDEALADAASAYANAITGLEARTRALLRQMPAPLVDRVRVFSQRLPADPVNSDASLADRFLTVIGVLNDANKFNNEITLTNEVRELDEETTAEVATLYLGVGQAYYVTADGKRAGIGTASEDGWEWTRADASAPAIAAAIAVFQNEVPAAFVRVPIRFE